MDALCLSAAGSRAEAARCWLKFSKWELVGDFASHRRMESWEGMGECVEGSEAAVRTRLAGLTELGLVQERPIRMHGTGGQVHAAQRKEGRSCTVLSVDRGARERSPSSRPLPLTPKPPHPHQHGLNFLPLC